MLFCFSQVWAMFPEVACHVQPFPRHNACGWQPQCHLQPFCDSWQVAERCAWANPNNHCAVLLLSRQRLLLHVSRQRFHHSGFLIVFYVVKWRKSTPPAFKTGTLIWLGHVQELSKGGWCMQNSWLGNKVWLYGFSLYKETKFSHCSGLQV